MASPGADTFAAWQLPALLRLWHLTSLDAPTVAVVWSMGFAWTAEVRLPIWVPLLLALVTWAVYIGDRLMDARPSTPAGPRFQPLASKNGLRERHIFHWRHRRILLPIAVCAAIAAACMILALMPMHDTVLAAAALAYFSGVHFRRTLPKWLPKELMVALLFTAGCALPAWNRSPQSSLLLPAFFFAVLAWINCHAIEHWESNELPLPRASVFLSGLLLGLVGLLLTLILARTEPHEAAILAAGTLSSLSLAFLDRSRNRLTPLTLRTAADLVLLTPALIPPFAWLTR